MHRVLACCLPFLFLLQELSAGRLTSEDRPLLLELEAADRYSSFLPSSIRLVSYLAITPWMFCPNDKGRHLHEAVRAWLTAAPSENLWRTLHGDEMTKSEGLVTS